MKSYHGFLGGQNKHVVLVRASDDKDAVVNPLMHHKLHSVDGLGWGKASAGSISDTARSILMDAFALEACKEYPNECKCKDDRVDPYYLDYAHEVIEHLPYSEKQWQLKQVDMLDWIFDRINTAKFSTPIKKTKIDAL